MLSRDRAISLLRSQLQEPVEALRHNDPEVEIWERVTHSIVEKAFGKHHRNANHFAVTVSYARQSDAEKQAWHLDHIKDKKALLRAFIKELQILSPDRSTTEDERFARMAVEEARKSTAEDERAHPMVGCVVVKDGKVLATSHRGEKRGRHAEFIALEEKLENATLAGCTVYTTLEPCTSRNHPKVPCANRLIERKVARVVIGMHDPNPDICGKGIRKLQGSDIEVTLFPHALIKELEELNRNFTRSFTDVQTTKEPVDTQQTAKQKRKLYTLLRKINCIECVFRFPPGPTDACFNGNLIRQINRDIESIRDGVIELLDLPEAQAIADVRIPAAPLNGGSWPWLETTWREHFRPVQELFLSLKTQVLFPGNGVKIADKWVDLMYPVNQLATELGFDPNDLAWCRESKVPGLVANGTAELVYEPDAEGSPHRLRIKDSPEPLMLIRRVSSQR